MERKVKVRGIFVHDGKLLCVWLKPYRDKKSEIDYWCVIGGGVDPGESVVDALRREVVEETGVEPVVGRLLYMQQYIHKDHEQLELFYNIKNPEDFTNVDLSKTTHGSEEIEKIAYIDPSKEKVLPEFLQALDLRNFSGEEPVEYFSYL